MTTIIALPDLHGEVQNLELIAEQLRAVDLVILPGDLTTPRNSGAGLASQVVESVRRHNQRVLAVPGNWDGPSVSAYLDREGINLDRQSVLMGGFNLLGLGGSLRSPFRAPNEYSEQQLDQALQQAFAHADAARPSVLVCHQPPKGTLNALTHTRLDVGSSAVRSFIEAHQPLLCLTGHIHEGVGVDAIGCTRVVNPGPLRYKGYAFVEIVDDAVVTVEIRRI